MFSSDVVPFAAGFPFPNDDGLAIAPYLLVTNNSGNLLACTATGQPLGVNASRIYATSEVGTVCPLVPGVIYKLTAASAVTQYADVWQAAAGKVNDADSGEGRFGIAMEAASADGSVINVMYWPESVRAGSNVITFDGTTGTNELRVPDNLADALSFENATGTTLMQIVTTTGSLAFNFGVDGTGIDVVFYGDTAGSNVTWDQSADSLIFTDSTPLVFGDGSDISAQWDGSNLVIATAVADTGAVEFGADDAGVDVILYGDTAGSNITWDQSADSLLITDSTPLSFGDGGDVLVQFDATNLAITTAVADTGAVVFGADDAGVDVIFYGDTASENITWDQSADDLILTAAVRIVGQGSTVMPIIPHGAHTTSVAAAGAIPITNYYSTLDSNAGATTQTLADGAQVGQLKKIQMIVDGGDDVVTPSNLSGGTTITFADVGDYAILVWDGTNWVAIELGNAADGVSAPVLA
jgi:hypothetical protein